MHSRYGDQLFSASLKYIRILCQVLHDILDKTKIISNMNINLLLHVSYKLFTIAQVFYNCDVLLQCVLYYFCFIYHQFDYLANTVLALHDILAEFTEYFDK